MVGPVPVGVNKFVFQVRNKTLCGKNRCNTLGLSGVTCVLPFLLDVCDNDM